MCEMEVGRTISTETAFYNVVDQFWENQGKHVWFSFTLRWHFPWLDVSRGRNTLFQPVPFPSIRRPSWPGGGSIVTRITACFCEGILPWGHGENMQTPHRKALSPTPPRVWTLMTRRRGHAPSTHSVPGGNRTQDLLAVRRQRYRLRHRAPRWHFFNDF